MKLNVFGFVRAVNDNLFNFVELVHAKQTGGVLACSAGLTPKTCAQRTQLDGTFQFQDLVAIEARQWNLAGANEGASVLGDICLISAGRKIPGPDHALL